ncbi:MAG: 1-deoxy-D-xylulose-5-phosphate reductoisomerase [Petroclostridium sp.]|uniref:1-deoxy-D-xylulose-5-phosphate reductoisomerase n=1 Tax=Petroclostridium xylanilyticum TaxID=1792311 RepID=UPI000B993E09|nr:1-deoxy-D-xylulose-5-phosphate reductoisomerase [Petroclostridium xylanilyticum]MDK2809301.1 1-deoxy-D-xylulose-5-phosphate reductoisomerase [Petroclostridium sp.]
MVENISILGSTGSIGTQTLEVIDNLQSIRVWGVSTNTRIDLLEEQIRKYRPVVAAVMDEDYAGELKDRVKDTNTRVVAGLDGLIEVSTIAQVEMVVTSVVGVVGLIPTLEAIKSGKHIALANKETLVTAGEIVMNEARMNKVAIIPVDSEHSAIFQCLKQNVEDKFVKKLIITASGGPFLGKKLEELENVTPEQALKHPKWNMGNKISIDSATLMNKGLEVIEAKWLFNIDLDRIQVLIHPQSIIHSMVEYIDHSIIAQLGVPDMKIPIQYAITYPERYYSDTRSLDFIQNNTLTFSQPDFETFKCLRLAYTAAREGGTMPAVLNAANEMAVQLFLEKRIGFIEIPQLIESAMKKHNNIINPSLRDILNSDSWAREVVRAERLGDSI